MSEQRQLTINQRQSPNNDKGYRMLCKENLPLLDIVSFINYNCTNLACQEGVVQGLSSFGMGQSFWRSDNMVANRKTSLRDREFFAHNAALY